VKSPRLRGTARIVHYVRSSRHLGILRKVLDYAVQQGSFILLYDNKGKYNNTLAKLMDYVFLQFM
jgi:hypothetical protein